MSVPDSTPAGVPAPTPMPAPTPSPAPSTASVAVPGLVPVVDRADAVAAFAALGNAWRWQMMKLLADGRKVSSSQMAALVKRDFDIVNKHLKVLRDARLVAWEYGEDRRQILYSIPAVNRAEPGVLDYGFIRVTLSRTN